MREAIHRTQLQSNRWDTHLTKLSGYNSVRVHVDGEVGNGYFYSHTFLILGSSHSYLHTYKDNNSHIIISIQIQHRTHTCTLVLTHHLALHCLELFLCRREAIRAHWFLPYFITAAFRISSCIHTHTRVLGLTQLSSIVTYMCQ